jgi:hypothetical protein
MNNLSQTARTFLKWRNCKLEEEEVYDMFLQEETKGISEIDRKKMRDKMIKIYDKKCKKLYNDYRCTILC